ncbi:MAG: GntR family transcriptional regulator [Bacteroidales bacterium]|nr:GntR family transcriptional regulator [Bacteroidales bacterium]
MKYSIDHKSPIPLHAQAEALLRKLIKESEFRNGGFLPNEVDLAKKLGISRNTIRQALNKLVFEGLLVRKKGVGTTVADRSVSSKVSNWLSFTQEMEAKGLVPETFEVTISWVRPIPDVMQVFGISAEKEVLKLVRLRGLKDNPFVYFVSYFHPRVGLSGEEDFSRPLYDILEQDYSTIAKLSREEIRACAADDQIAQHLNIPVGFPVLVRKRVVFDPGDRPIEYNVGYYKSDSFVYCIESDRED